MEKSYNGWPASKLPSQFGGLDNRTVPGTKGVRLAPGVRAGDVATVLFYVAAELHKRVESGDLYVQGDDWGYSYRLNRNANNLSCHSSATAFDWNATRHPNGKRGTFTKAQVKTIRDILSEVGGIVRWGGDFTGTPDEMHFEIVASPATVAMVAARLNRTGAAPSSPVTTLPVQEDDDDMQLNELYDARDNQGRNFLDFQNWCYDVLLPSVQSVAGAMLFTRFKSADGAERNMPDFMIESLRQVQAIAGKYDAAPAGPVVTADVDYDRVAKTVADEADRRARDGDPNTGPTS